MNSPKGSDAASENRRMIDQRSKISEWIFVLGVKGEVVNHILIVLRVIVSDATDNVLGKSHSDVHSTLING
jgi:hypothetical protein